VAAGNADKWQAAAQAAALIAGRLGDGNKAYLVVGGVFEFGACVDGVFYFSLHTTAVNAI